MASAPRYKVYNAAGEYVASFKYPSDAAVLVAIGYPDGGTIRLGHGAVLYRSSPPILALLSECGAAASYDDIAQAVIANETELQRDAYRRAYGKDPD